MAHPQLLEAINNKDSGLDDQRFERQPGAWAWLMDQVHLLRAISLSRLGEMTVLSNAQKPTHGIKENEEMGDMF